MCSAPRLGIAGLFCMSKTNEKGGTLTSRLVLEDADQTWKINVDGDRPAVNLASQVSLKAEGILC